MEQLHAGDRLSAAAAEVASQLPESKVTLLSTSIEGAAIAAVCAAQHPMSTWRLVELAWQPVVVSDAPIVFVEPVEPGRAWRSAVHGRYPDAAVIIAAAAHDTLLHAA